MSFGNSHSYEGVRNVERVTEERMLEAWARFLDLFDFAVEQEVETAIAVGVFMRDFAAARDKLYQELFRLRAVKHYELRDPQQCDLPAQE